MLVINKYYCQHLFFFQIAIDLCIADLYAYRMGTQLFKSHIEALDDLKVDGHYKHNGNKLKDDNTNYSALKGRFVNGLIHNNRDRYYASVNS
jgi:hypothetical protein